MTSHASIQPDLPEDGANVDNLFRGIPGYPDPNNGRTDDMLPLDTGVMARSSEYVLIALATVGLLALFYWMGKTFMLRRQSKRQVRNIININERYKDLVEREETLQHDLLASQDQLNSVQFLLKAIIVVILIAGFGLYRQGPAYLAYILKEMPHVTITLPLVVISFLYMWQHLLAGRRERYIKEQNDLKPRMREQEKLLRDTIDPKLYDTFKRIILQDEKEQIERMRVHESGCSEKCRVKNTSLELDLQRNAALVQGLTSFDWCDRCANGKPEHALSPPSGKIKGCPPCTNGCGMRLVTQCKPLMEQYSAVSGRISKLQEKFNQLEQRDISFQKYKDQKEEFKKNARQAQLNVSSAANVDNFLDGMNLSQLQQQPQQRSIAEPQEAAVGAHREAHLQPRE